MPVASMAEMRRQEEEAKKAKEKEAGEGKGPRENYVGGEKSGLAVETPLDDKWATANLNAHAATDGPASSGAPAVTIWRNGFTIGDGPLRPADDPENKKFLDDIARGNCPDELKQNPTDDVNVSVVDKRGEDCKENQPSGSSTGGYKPAQPSKIENAVSGGEGSVAVDETKKKTKVQIRFHDGSKKAQEFNEESTVGDLRAFCQQVTGQPMSVKGGFPPKPLTDDSQTLKAAGLCGAAVTVAPA